MCEMSHKAEPHSNDAPHLLTANVASASPVVVCLRGPSRSGKTSIAERVIAHFESRGVRVAYVKRTHHQLDLPHKASGRIWARHPAAMLMASEERLQLTLTPVERDVETLVRSLPAAVDLVLVETHTPEAYPTLAAETAEDVAEENLLGRWSLPDIETDAQSAVAAIETLVPSNLTLHRALREAALFHGGHACAGLILGTRLALFGTAILGIDVPDRNKRLVTTVEIDRCAADAIQSVTGCRAGRRTLRFLDYGKLAAIFVDQHANRAIRVAVQGDLRDRARGMALPGEERQETQRRVYLALPDEELFTFAKADPAIDQSNLPGPPRNRVQCVRCGEEVSDGRDVITDDGRHCRPCAFVTLKGAY